jgi:hypothetical protein
MTKQETIPALEILAHVLQDGAISLEYESIVTLVTPYIAEVIGDLGQRHWFSIRRHLLESGIRPEKISMLRRSLDRLGTYEPADSSLLDASDSAALTEASKTLELELINRLQAAQREHEMEHGRLDEAIAALEVGADQDSQSRQALALLEQWASFIVGEKGGFNAERTVCPRD